MNPLDGDGRHALGARIGCHSRRQISRTKRLETGEGAEPELTVETADQSFDGRARCTFARIVSEYKSTFSGRLGFPLTSSNRPSTRWIIFGSA